MAKYYVDGKLVEIKEGKKGFSQGSEGILYLQNQKLYKIYYPNSLNEGFGNKRVYHQALLEIKDLFEMIILPENLIFQSEKDYSYCGYVTKMVGEGKKKKEGITTLNWDDFLFNIIRLEQEIALLSEYRFQAVDFAFHNVVFSEEEKRLYMVDPGRYHHQTYFTISDYKRVNQLILTDFLKHLLEREMIFFHLVPNHKRNKLLLMLEKERNHQSYSIYFQEQVQKYENVQEMIRRKGKYC